MLLWAGLKPSLYGMHSPRSGGTTDAFAAEIPDYIIDLKGRWRCPNSKYAYARPTDKEIVRQCLKSKAY